MKGCHDMMCLECAAEFHNGKRFSNHIKREHSLSGEDYTIKHLYGGTRPACVSCGNLTRYSAFGFKRYCGTCASIAMKEGGSKGGKAEAWNKGRTAKSDDRIKSIADRLTGNGNPFYGRRHDDLTRVKISISKRLAGETINSRIQSRSGDFELITPIEEYESRQRQYLQFKCKTCGHTQEKTLQAFERGSLCEICHPISTSQWQLDVEEWVRSLGVQVKRGDRTAIAPKEIDIFVPERGFGIECHGLYFHSDAKDGNDRLSHLHKAEIAETNGIRLLQIFFDEWRDRQEVVKGMIRSRLDIGVERVGARKCKIMEIDASQQRAFFESSHLSGYSPARIAWGLSWNDQIIACLSVRVPRQSKWSSFFEISRFAVSPGFRVQGGLSRLIRTALNWSKSQGKDGMMTYVDRRVGTGSGYKSCGFIEHGSTGADYWYTDFSSRFDRFKFRARDGKSERQVALESKVFKIWGAGSRIMTLGDI